MEILRTPDQRFESIKGYPFEPHYTTITTHDGSELRIHHIDEGPKDGPILLAMHGQPVWSYLYSKMIPFLTSAGIRVVAPDLPGYGKSDKPASREDYSYQRQVDWMGQWLTENDFSEITFLAKIGAVSLALEWWLKIQIDSSRSLQEIQACPIILMFRKKLLMKSKLLERAIKS